ncbi:hypothetical protein BLGI_4916 [Brevibacillus laterosporus GI-9]|nr:hypothetical protein BLGI_4916 [Brevibacillus laterosporus GI-9]
MRVYKWIREKEPFLVDSRKAHTEYKQTMLLPDMYNIMPVQTYF